MVGVFILCLCHSFVRHGNMLTAKRLKDFPCFGKGSPYIAQTILPVKKIGPHDGFLLLPHHFSAKLSGETLC